MKSSLILFACLVALAVFAARVTPQNGKRLTPADEVKLKAMIDQHRKVRARLPVEYRNTLDQLTALVRKDLLARISNGNILDDAMAYVHKHVPGLTSEEVRTLTEYSLGGIAGGDPVGGGSNPIGSAAGGSGQQDLLNATKQMQETQMSFNLQYLQLQSQMQSENRSYTAISNIMKTKHDTVKNSISNVR